MSYRCCDLWRTAHSQQSQRSLSLQYLYDPWMNDWMLGDYEQERHEYNLYRTAFGRQGGESGNALSSPSPSGILLILRPNTPPCTQATLIPEGRLAARHHMTLQRFHSSHILCSGAAIVKLFIHVPFVSSPCLSCSDE